jgi:hypothetical protein
MSVAAPVPGGCVGHWARVSSMLGATEYAFLKIVRIEGEEREMEESKHPLWKIPVVVIACVLLVGILVGVFVKDRHIMIRIEAYVIGIGVLLMIPIWRIRKYLKRISDPIKGPVTVQELELELNEKFGKIPDELKGYLLQKKIVQPAKYRELLEDVQLHGYVDELKRNNNSSSTLKDVFEYLKQYWS